MSFTAPLSTNLIEVTNLFAAQNKIRLLNSIEHLGELVRGRFESLARPHFN